MKYGLIFILIFIFSTQICFGNGIIKGKIIYPGGSPEGIVLFFFNDATMEYMVDGMIVYSPDGTFEIKIPPGVYYIQAQVDINKNGQTDEGDLMFTYGGKEPIPVRTGDEIVFYLGKDGKFEDKVSTSLTGLPPSSNNQNTSYSQYPSCTPSPVSENNQIEKINGRVILPGLSPAGVLLLLFRDPSFETLETASEVTSPDGTFSINIKKNGIYYLQAFYDANGNGQIDQGDISVSYGGTNPIPVKPGDEVNLIFDTTVAAATAAPATPSVSVTTPQATPISFTPTPVPTIGNTPNIPSPSVKPTIVSIPELSSSPSPNRSTTPLELSSSPSPTKSGTSLLPDDLGNKNNNQVINSTPSPGIEKKSILKGRVSGVKNFTELVIFIFSDINFKNFVTSVKIADETGAFQVELPEKNYYIQAFLDINKNQVLDVDDVIISYSDPDTKIAKAARPGEKEILIDLSELNNVTDKGDNKISSISSPIKEYTLKGKILWPGHIISKAIIEAYSDVTFQIVKGRAIIEKPGGYFSLKLPEGKYFLSAVIDDNMDGQMDTGDGMGLYGVKSISSSDGSPEPFIVAGDKEVINIDIPVTDVINFSGEIVSLEEYDKNKNSKNQIINKDDLENYIKQISGYEERYKKINPSGKIYYSNKGYIYIFNLSGGTVQSLAQGFSPSVSLSGDKIAYIGNDGKILMSSGEIIKGVPNSYQSFSISPDGKFLAYQCGNEINVIDVINRNEQKKILADDINGAPYQISWMGGDGNIVYLIGAGRNLGDKVTSGEDKAVNKSSTLPFDGFSQQNDEKNQKNNIKENITDGLFPIMSSMSSKKSSKRSGFYIWNRKTDESYFMDLNEYCNVGNLIWSSNNPNLFVFSKGIPSQIWLGRLTDKGIEKTQLTVYGGTSPAWSPDGKNIVYVNNSQLWIFNLETHDEVPLLKSSQPVYGESPSWSY